MTKKEKAALREKVFPLRERQALNRARRKMQFARMQDGWAENESRIRQQRKSRGKSSKPQPVIIYGQGRG